MNLFGEIEIAPAAPKLNKRAWKAHRHLIAMHGTTEGKKCGDCDLLNIKCYNNKTYFKCAKIDPDGSGSASTDHRKNWIACGLWKEVTA